MRDGSNLSVQNPNDATVYYGIDPSSTLNWLTTASKPPLFE